MLTVSLELAKKMRKLGRDKNTHFFETTLDEFLETSGSYKEQGVVFLPTAQEILDELPYKCELPYKGDFSLLTIQKIDTGKGILKYAVGYFNKDEMRFTSSVYGETNLAEALGQLRCRCKENGYLDTNHKE